MLSLYTYIIFHLFVAHDFHLSKTEVRYKEDISAIQISTHIFIDDLEEVLANQGHSELHLFTNKEDINAEEYIFQYLQSNLLIEVDDTEMEYTWVGKEISEDLSAVWCYLEITDTQIASDVKLLNKVLHDLFSDQKNVVSFQYNSQKKKHMFFSQGDKYKSLSL